ncbi:Beta-adaptin appendage, c-terminal subdomain, partial [Globisporangium splendens]
MTPSRRRTLHAMVLYVLAVAAMARGAAAATANGKSNAVFCTDVGIDFGVQRRNSRPKETDEKDAVATSCLRHPVMMAAMGHLAAKMPAFALSAVDCVHEAVSEDGAAFFAVLSLCSRSNIQHQTNDVNVWDTDVRAQLEQVVGAEGNHDKVVIDTGENVAVQVRQVLVSPSYTLPDGKGMPRFEFQGAKLRHDADGSTKADVSVRNVGKVPLHLYRVTLTELLDEEQGTTKLVSPATLALLPSPAMVVAGKSASIEFTSSATSSLTTLVSSKSYAIYVSHSGFRSHRFDGTLDGEILKTTNVVVGSTEKTDDFFGGIVSHASKLDPMMTSFPYGSWQVFSVGIVVVVGVAATMYIRRKWPRRISACLQRSLKPARSASSSTGSSPKSIKMKNASGWKKSKKSDVGLSEDHTLSDRELDELESERMSAIQMQRTPPRSTSGTFWKPLDLDGTARLDPKRFENMWEEYHQRYQSNEIQAGRVDSTALVEKMQARGVTCMASGTVNGVEKYVFYAKQHDSRSDWFFFLVVDITLATSNLGVTVRTSSDASESLVEEFVKMTKATIGDSLSKS